MDRKELEAFAQIFGCSVEEIEKDMEDLVSKGLMSKDHNGDFCFNG